MTFQSQVNAALAPAVPGDFASGSPRAAVVAGPGGVLAGSAGVSVGRFAWLDTATYATAANNGSGLPDGFVRNSHAAVLSASSFAPSLLVPPGQPVELFATGDFWTRNGGASSAVPGQKVFASITDGSIATAAAGTSLSGYVETNWFVRSVGAVGEMIKISSYPVA